MTRRLLTIASAVLVGTLSARADFELPLTITETQGAGGGKFISNGVPLLPGQAMDTRELHVLGPDGKEVPSQFRVLARWWRGDNSIRWVLVDFPTNTAEKGSVVYRLVGRKAGAEDGPARAVDGPARESKLKLTQDDDFIRVDTGAALFEISRKKFNLFNRVQFDVNLDGAYTDDETVVAPDAKLGSVVTDPQGRKYYSSNALVDLKVIDSGPVRVTIMAKGTHVSTEDGAFKPALYGYEIYMTFNAGQPSVNIDAVLTNNFAESIGEPHIEDWSVVTRIGSADSGGFGMNALTSGGYCDAGGGPDESLVIYQDSLGTTTWKNCPGFEPRTNTLSTFRGYKVFKVAADGKTRTELDSGDFCRGVAQCGRGNMGCVIATKYFWQQFPKAIEYGDGGLLRYGMFPKEYSTVHWLEDGSAKGHEFQLFFYIKGCPKAYTAMSDAQRPWAHVVLDNYLSQPMAVPGIEHCGQAGAMSDLGPWLMNDKVPNIDFALERWERRYAMADYLKGNSFGWQVFGNRWEESMGHSPWNYEAKVTSASLFNYMTTRQPNWLERGLRVSRQARDVRAYLIDDPEILTKWSKPGAYNRQSIMESFRRKQPAGEAHPYRRQGWFLCNHEHLNLDEVYDLYLLTGDPRALRCMEVIAAHGAMSTGMPSKNPVAIYRTSGWCVRTLMRYYELTGDEKFKPYVDTAAERFWTTVDKAGVYGASGSWMTGIYNQGVIAIYYATGDERMRDLAIGVADWCRNYEVTPEGYPYGTVKERYSVPPEQRGKPTSWVNAYMLNTQAFAYHQTGDPVYLEAFEFTREKLGVPSSDWLAFLPTAMYYAYSPRADKQAPAAIADLKAIANKGEVMLTWTAPGDDGNAGRADVYQIKHAGKPILEFVPWPDKKDSHVAFWGAENVADEPSPKKAGASESYTLKSLPSGKHYFAIKARDEQSNQSPISNVVEVDVQ